MRQGLVRLTLLVLVLLLIFGVYRLLTIEPIDAGTFFDAAGAPLVLLDPGMFGENGQETLAALDQTQGTDEVGLFVPVNLDEAGQLLVADPGAANASAVTLTALLAEHPDARFVVELRKPDLQSLAALLHAVDSQGARDRVLAVVDDQQLVDVLRGQAPDLATAMTTAEVSSFLLTSRLRLTPFYRPGAPALLLPAAQFSGRLRDAAHSRGIALFVQSPNDRSVVKDLIDQGVDGVVVQRP